MQCSLNMEMQPSLAQSTDYFFVAIVDCFSSQQKVHCWQDGTVVHKLHALHKHFNFLDDLALQHFTMPAECTTGKICCQGNLFNLNCL